MGNKNLSLWKVRLILFQDSVNDIEKFFQCSANKGQMMFAFYSLSPVTDT